MTENDPLAGLNEDEWEALSSETALVVASIQDAYADKTLSKEEVAALVFRGNDLISSYLEVHMGLERDEAVKISSNLLAGLIESGELK